jgi:hypothetical protein
MFQTTTRTPTNVRQTTVLSQRPRTSPHVASANNQLPTLVRFQQPQSFYGTFLPTVAHLITKQQPPTFQHTCVQDPNKTPAPVYSATVLLPGDLF